MTRDIPVILEQYMVRAIMALSSSATAVADDDLREDLRDSAAMLVRLAMDRSADNLREWCDRTIVLLDDSLVHEVERLSPAKLAVLRLRSALLPAVTASPSAPVADKKPAATAVSSGKSQQRILEAIMSNPDARPSELVAALWSAMSERTVKRCLKEMVDSGILRKIQTDGSVRYRILAGSAS